jgi:hypothetical protein
MKTLPGFSGPLLRALLVPPLLCMGVASLAADKAAVDAARARYEQDRQVCASGRSNQDRATCMREAQAALAEVQRGRAGDGNANYARNAKARCAALPSDQRQACEARMQGAGTTSGSAAAGGIYRELVTRETVVQDQQPVDAAASGVAAEPQKSP